MTVTEAEWFGPRHKETRQDLASLPFHSTPAWQPGWSHHVPFRSLPCLPGA